MMQSSACDDHEADQLGEGVADAWRQPAKLSSTIRNTTHGRESRSALIR
jgi:hypothetical protein